jgi:hypothetical protein
MPRDITRRISPRHYAALDNDEKPFIVAIKDTEPGWEVRVGDMQVWRTVASVLGMEGHQRRSACVELFALARHDPISVCRHDPRRAPTNCL